jgi:hypothetical protein
MKPSFLSLYSLLGCLEEILQVLNRNDSKSTSIVYFFYFVTLKPLSLRPGLFLPYMLGQHYSLYFESMFVFFFLIKKKKEGLKGCRCLLFYNFQISYVCLIDDSVYDAFIQLPLYN